MYIFVKFKQKNIKLYFYLNKNGTLIIFIKKLLFNYLITSPLQKFNLNEGNTSFIYVLNQLNQNYRYALKFYY